MNYERYFQENREKHLGELKELLAFPSISCLSEHKPDMARAAEWLLNNLIESGFENAHIHQTNGHPIITADYLHAPGKPTVLVYGHYDVQPVDPLHLWITPPFEPDIRDGKIYARGATDDKGQMFLHIKAIEAILKQEGELPVNIKLCIEGEEEMTSPNLPSFLEANKEKLSADFVVISDTAFLETGRPAIPTGLRGICSLDVIVNTANSDLHSGTYGGGVPNALHALVSLLASLHDKQGRVAVEGFYSDVPDISPLMKTEFAKLNYDEEQLRINLELGALYGEEGFSFIERVGARPTLELHGVHGGFQGEGLKTVIPKEAHAKITCRLVADQDPEDILDKMKNHLERHLQSGAKLSIITGVKIRAFNIDPSHRILQLAADAYEDVYGVRALFTKEGGGIPIVEAFSRILQAPVVMMGFGLPDEKLHAPNEHFNLENFDKGLRTMVSFLKKI
ncbi:dipeptidase [Cohnella lupini]|uniref:Acetylornithine deacetylase/succinyl-diaminopimelate desuccinylase-like protein n=1 Tax=Cohnella lupini TaxID=1294267 RepID=A0A3D9I4D9_9BACL|nr:dipeptidase [Cohnella lupini]RED56617.1 acetylornithine deacetylase/succinyl-diaminopimelate desuccinylase-like protein [Cohnella lupini]